MQTSGDKRQNPTQTKVELRSVHPDRERKIDKLVLRSCKRQEYNIVVSIKTPLKKQSMKNVSFLGKRFEILSLKNYFLKEIAEKP